MFSKILILFFDYLLILITLPIWLTLILLFYFLILIFDGKPVYFIQDRYGLNKKIFKIIKFRTIKKTINNNEDQLSKIAIFLRRSSIDELPQIFNVIKRDMSIVGPRPLPLNINLSMITDKQFVTRSSILPGITGLSQVNFTGKKRNLLEKIELDIKYVNDRSSLYKKY